MTRTVPAGPTKADAQRRRVLAESAAIFSRRGFRATSMNEIAAAVGLSKPTLSPTTSAARKSCCPALLRRAGRELVSAATVAAAGSPLAAIRDLIASRVAYTCRNQALLKVCFEEEHELPVELADEVLQRRRAFEDLFLTALTDHLATHPAALIGMTPRVYVNMCLGAVNWCYKWYRSDGPCGPDGSERRSRALSRRPSTPSGAEMPATDPDPFDDVLPADPEATMVGRLLDPEVGPCVVTVRDREFVDLTALSPTTSALLDRDDLLDVLREAPAGRRWSVAAVAQASRDRDTTVPHLLAPIDLQVVKAAGVTFVRSLLERVIEERRQGRPHRRRRDATALVDTLGGALATWHPARPRPWRSKTCSSAEGLWSPYLEVGIGPDPEIFTKAPVLSAVGYGAAVGVLERSTWNNPEPEVVLVVNSSGTVVGATLGNDVNLRDFEGRSALLLGTAKDNNASCAIGPLIRLCDRPVRPLLDQPARGRDATSPVRTDSC